MHDTDHDLVHNERIGYYSNTSMWTERIHIMHTLVVRSVSILHEFLAIVVHVLRRWEIQQARLRAFL